MTHPDLGAAAAQVASLADGVPDDQLDAPTTCPGWTVATLLDHLIGLTGAFAAAASKSASPPPATFSGELPPDWRTRLRVDLDALVAAWRRPEAWEGEATAGGVTMPAEVMGVVALDELVLHGWDLARSTGQPFSAGPADIAACTGFAAAMSVPGQEASREGLYGPVVPVDADASDLDKLLGYAGRDPRRLPA